MLKKEDILLIQDYKSTGFTKSQIVDSLGFSYKTVKKYWNWDLALERKKEVKAKRKSKCDKYKDFILERLRIYPGFNSIQIFEQLRRELKKQGLEIDIGESTMRRYVNKLRKEENLPKERKQRIYRAVVDPDPGKQAQYDFGEYDVFIDYNGKKKKVYFGMVILSYSRYRYVEFRDKPLKTKDAIEILEHAFDYWGGYPEVVVIDQDTKMVSYEKNGVYSLTEQFSAYEAKQPFRIRPMHKRDPESKGRVERANYYLEQNFLNGYRFDSLEKLNEDALEWLEEIANKRPNATTKESPASRFRKEKPKLQARDAVLDYEIIPQLIAKDNTVTYKGNRYDVPAGSYVKGLKKQANIYVYPDHIEVYSKETGEYLSEYKLEDVKGKLYTLDGRAENSDECVRGLKQELATEISDYPYCEELIDKVIESNPDFRTDQLKELKKTISEWKANKPVLYQVFKDMRELKNINVEMINSNLLYVQDRLDFDLKAKPCLSEEEFNFKLYNLFMFYPTGSVMEYSKDYIKYLKNEFAEN